MSILAIPSCRAARSVRQRRTGRLWGVLLLVLLGTADGVRADSLAAALERFQALTSYRATVRMLAEGGERLAVRYFYRKPGWIRMEFIRPHKGLVLIYDPRAQRVRIWPFGLGRLPRLSFDPDNPLLRGPGGLRVEDSDVGTQLANFRALLAYGTLSRLANGEIAAQPVAGFEIGGLRSAGRPDVRRYRVWLAQDSLFPLRFETFGDNGNTIERVDLADAKIDVPFPARFFMP